MAIRKYLSLNGRFCGSYVTRSQKTWFLTDALGSVTATLNNSGNVVSTYRYQPYGATLATTGVGNPQRFGWAGDTGSRSSDRRFAEQYNWHRHYGQIQGQWTSRDILWPDELAYGYVNGFVTRAIDPSGLRCCCCATLLGNPSSVKILTYGTFAHLRPGNNWIGHYLEIKWQTLYISDGVNDNIFDDCILEWKEMSPDALIPQGDGTLIPPGTWGKNVIGLPNLNARMFSAWTNRRKQCPGADSGVLRDEPTRDWAVAVGFAQQVAPNSQGVRRKTRTLYIQVKLRSAGNCAMKTLCFPFSPPVPLQCGEKTVQITQQIGAEIGSSGTPKPIVHLIPPDPMPKDDPPPPPKPPWP